MWVAKIGLNGEKGLFGSRTKKYRVAVYGYPISFYEKAEGIYVFMAGFIYGKEKNKKAFLKDLKKSSRVLQLDIKEDFVIAQIKEPKDAKPFYNHLIIHIEPVQILENGENIWNIGSWNKKELLKFIAHVKKYYEGKLLKMMQKKISNVSVFSIQPELTKKQKKALELAVKKGYYAYPRQIGLKELAKNMNISYSTFQAHLRKAEQKILPIMSKRIE